MHDTVRRTTKLTLNKIDQLHFLAQKTKASFISIAESWLDESVPDTEINIPGYVVVRKDCDRNGGGVCAFIKDNITFNVRTDINVINLKQFSMISCMLPKTKPILCGWDIDIKVYESGVLSFGISDHCITFCTGKTPNPHIQWSKKTCNFKITILVKITFASQHNLKILKN